MTIFGSGTLRLVLASSLALVSACSADTPPAAAPVATPVAGSSFLGSLTPTNWFGSSSTGVKLLSENVSAPIPAREMEDVLAFVYRGISSNYVDRSSLRPVVVAGLSGLSRLDPKVTDRKSVV